MFLRRKQLQSRQSLKVQKINQRRKGLCRSRVLFCHINQKREKKRGGPGILREITGAIMKNTICKFDKRKKKFSFSL